MEASDTEMKQQCCSEAIWSNPSLGYVVLAVVNCNFMLMWMKGMNIATLIGYFALFYIIAAYVVITLNYPKKDDYTKTNAIQYVSKETIESKLKMIIARSEGVKLYMRKVVEVSDPMVTTEFLVGVYLVSLMTSVFSDMFIGWVVMNYMICYAPIEKAFPNFIGSIIGAIKNFVGGVLNGVMMKVPKYVENDGKE